MSLPLPLVTPLPNTVYTFFLFLGSGGGAWHSAPLRTLVSTIPSHVANVSCINWTIRQQNDSLHKTVFCSKTNSELPEVDDRVVRLLSDICNFSRHNLRSWFYFKNFLFLFSNTGGYDGHDFLSSVEYYDFAKNEWKEVTNMSAGRSGLGSAVGYQPCLRR